MDNKKHSGTAVILYFGVGIETTPKLALIKQTLEKKYDSVTIAGITAKPYTSEKHHKVIHISSRNKPLKVIQTALAILKLFIWLNKTSPRLIYAVNPIPGIIATVFNKIKSTKYIYETLEIFCGIDYFPYSKKYRPLWYFLEKTTINNSVKSFTTDEFREKFIRRFLKLKTNKLTYTYNTNSKTSALPAQVHNDPLILSYCGGVYAGREIDQIIRAFALLKASSPDIQLIIAGGGDPDYIQELTALSEKLGILASVEFTGSVPNNILKQIMNNSKITFAFYKRNSLNNRLNSPNKIFDAVFCRTTLITTESPLSKKIIYTNNIGATIKSTTPVEISNQCRAILDTTSSLSQFDALIDKYSWENEEHKILNILGTILK